MRRLVFPVIAALGLVMVGPSSAFADDPANTVSVQPTAVKKLCKVTDPKLDELSGMVATKTGYVVVDDGTTVASHKKVFFLDTKCEIQKEVSYSGSPRDTEDLILSPDGGTLWIADIGDNNYSKEDGSRRPSLGLWKMPADGSKKPTLYRVKYPEGDYHDAEALLLTGDNIPVIVTKEIGKPANLYEPSGALEAGSETGVPLKKVGTLSVSATETAANPYARIGNKTITGGAISPGGDKVVLRTYTDALEWDVSGNDVLAAIKAKPRTTALPNELMGEAITYSADGKYFYTVSDMNGDKENANNVLQYTPATTVAAVKKNSVAAESSGKAWYADLTIDQITYAIGAIGVLGLILVGVGVLGIVRHRKRVASMPPPLDDLDDAPGGPENELIGVSGSAQRAAVYGGARPAAAAAPGVYGGPPVDGAPKRGGVYGGESGGRPQYARPQQQPAAQPPRGPQQPAPGRGGVYGGGSGGGAPGPQYGQPRGPQGGQHPQQGQQRPPQGGQRPPGVYGGQQGGGQRPPQRDGYADRNAYQDGRFDNPGYRR